MESILQRVRDFFKSRSFKILVALIGLPFVLGALCLCVSCWVIGSASESAARNKVLPEIIIAGKVVNRESNEWTNGRLVLLFLKGKEIGRSVTALGEFTESKQGKHDGLFAIKIKNDYDLSLNNLNAAPKSPAKFASHEEFFGSNYFYQWIDKMEEGGLYRIPVPSKNIEYVIKVVAGDVARLPPELKVPNSTLLKNDSTIVVSLNDSTGQASADANAKIQNVKYGSGTQTLDMSKITVPLNNCGGNAAVSQKYIQTQTFIHQFAAEIGFRLGVEIPLGAWLKLVPELQTKYGYEHGQIDTRTVEYAMVANARTNVVYTVLWKEQWESGTANLTSGKDNIAIPFRVRTNLISQIDSQSLPCN